MRWMSGLDLSTIRLPLHMPATACGLVLGLLAMFPARALAQCVFDNSGAVCVPQDSPTGPGNPSSSRPVPHVDPCFLAQNAMRPCPVHPVGVDPRTVGTWKLPLKGGPWVLEIYANGTYKFHSEAGDGVASNQGKFSSNNGHWFLKATNGYTDGGTYRFKAPDIWIATGHLGTAHWHLTSAKTASRRTASTVTANSQPASPNRR